MKTEILNRKKVLMQRRTELKKELDEVEVELFEISQQESKEFWDLMYRDGDKS